MHFHAQQRVEVETAAALRSAALDAVVGRIVPVGICGAMAAQVRAVAIESR